LLWAIPQRELRAADRRHAPRMIRGAASVTDVQQQRGRRSAARDRDVDVVAALGRETVAVAGAILQAGAARSRRGQASGALCARHRGGAGGAQRDAAVVGAASDGGGGSLAAEVAFRSSR